MTKIKAESNIIENLSEGTVLTNKDSINLYVREYYQRASYLVRCTESKLPCHVGETLRPWEPSQKLRDLGCTQNCIEATAGIAECAWVHDPEQRLKRGKSKRPPCCYCFHQGNVWRNSWRSRGTRPLGGRFPTQGMVRWLRRSTRPLGGRFSVFTHVELGNL